MRGNKLAESARRYRTDLVDCYYNSPHKELQDKYFDDLAELTEELIKLVELFEKAYNMVNS